MTGLTNWFRGNVLEVIRGNDHAGVPGTWVNLLTAMPTADPLIAGGTDETEWSLGRVQVNLAGPTEPYWGLELATDDGVWIFNQGAVEWSSGDTTALLATATVIGLGVWTASTGGNLIGYDFLYDDESTSSIEPGDPVSLATRAIKLQLRSYP